MRKLGHITYKRLHAQAEQAKELGLDRLANAVLSTIGSIYEENNQATYSYDELENKVYHSLWKSALEIVSYHDLVKIDIQELDKAIVELKNKVIGELEDKMKVRGQVGKNEPKLPGQE